jgi:hypothetical protein
MGAEGGKELRQGLLLLSNEGSCKKKRNQSLGTISLLPVYFFIFFPFFYISSNSPYKIKQVARQQVPCVNKKFL